MNKRYFFYIIIVISLFTSCGLIHNLPDSATPNTGVDPNLWYSFVDQMVISTPIIGRKIMAFLPIKLRDPYSLMKIATDRGDREQLLAFERGNMLRLSKRIAPKKRVFILVHGFNADEESVVKQYKYISDHIVTNPKTDEIIRFYWDGLRSTSPFVLPKTGFQRPLLARWPVNLD
jgi:hypothetical protein